MRRWGIQSRLLGVYLEAGWTDWCRPRLKWAAGHRFAEGKLQKKGGGRRRVQALSYDTDGLQYACKGRLGDHDRAEKPHEGEVRGPHLHHRLHCISVWKALRPMQGGRHGRCPHKAYNDRESTEAAQQAQPQDLTYISYVFVTIYCILE